MRFANFDGNTNNDAVTYTLDDNADGLFAIVANTGEVTVAPGATVDYEAASSHNVVVRATFSDGSSTTESFTIEVLDADDAPTAYVDQAVAVEAGGVNNSTTGSNPTGNVLTNDTVDAGDTKEVIGVATGALANAF